MSNWNGVAIGCFFAYIFIREAMSSKFIFGFVTGAYVATQYDLKPYFDHAERKIRDKISEFKKEAENSENSDANNLRSSVQRLFSTVTRKQD